MTYWAPLFQPLNEMLMAATFPAQLANHVMAFSNAIHNGGCKYGCSHARTDGSRLPWEPTHQYGGWGGHEYFETAPGTSNTPVVFIHGNQRDACDWETHADAFLANGYTGDELWAITFKHGTSSHAEMARQLDAFVQHVRAYTGSDSVVLVAHSLGVTGARFWLSECDRYDWVETFIGLSGANHGIEYARVAVKAGVAEGPYRVSQFLRSDYERIPDHPLAELNEDETPGDIEYYTIRGTFDELFWGPSRESPILEGATRNVSLSVGHDGTREDSRAIDLILKWAQSGD